MFQQKQSGLKCHALTFKGLLLNITFSVAIKFLPCVLLLSNLEDVAM